MILRKHRALASTFTSALAGIALTTAAHAAQVVVINNNAAGVGFNDPTAAAPTGGNPGTTIGQQRLIAFQYAADIWGRRIASSVPIRVGAQFTALTCNQTSAVLGSAGPNQVFRDFAGAPRASTYYVGSEANALTGSDQDPTVDDINANFNSNIGQPGCLQALGWYYGLDGNPPSGTEDFVTVLLHEMGHGLGFLSLVDQSSGTKFNGFDDAYMVYLESHGASPADFPSMSNAQRVAAQVNTGNLHWTGPNVQAAASFLTAGTVGTHVRMYAPNPIVSGSSVSHWDTVATPNLMMEPNYTGPLFTANFEKALFRDIGYKLVPSRLDFFGDSRSGIVWRNTSSGDTVISLMNGPNTLAVPTIKSTTGVGSFTLNWTLATSGDFNGDGKSDLLWRDSSTGANVISLINGASITASQAIATIPPAWSVAGAGDFNGDGRTDILWRNNATGDTVVSFLTGTPTVVSISSSNLIATVPAPWTVAGIGDFNGDGKADILWRNTVTGDNVVFLMNGSTITSSALVGTVPVNWSVAGIGDFNGDGKADILWRENSTGANVISLMNGASVSAYQGIAAIPPSWNVAEVGNFGSDGKAGILWRNSSTGDAVVSLTNGTAITSSTYVGTFLGTWVTAGANGN